MTDNSSYTTNINKWAAAQAYLGLLKGFVNFTSINRGMHTAYFINEDAVGAGDLLLEWNIFVFHIFFMDKALCPCFLKIAINIFEKYIGKGEKEGTVMSKT